MKTTSTLRTLSLISFLLPAAALTSQASADTLVKWEFPSASPAPTSFAVGLEATDAAFGAFGNVASGSSTYGFSTASGGNLFARAHVLGDSASFAVTNNTYVEFTLAPDSGKTFDLSTISFQIGAQTISADQAPYTGHYFVRSSLDGFTQNLGTDSHTSTGVRNVVSWNPNPTTINLGSEFQGIDHSITFRIYVWVETTTVNQNQTIRIDDVTISGGLSQIPEPANASLVWGGFAAAFALLGRRGRVRPHRVV
jgi:hypothetical protein